MLFWLSVVCYTVLELLGLFVFLLDFSLSGLLLGGTLRGAVVVLVVLVI